MKNSLADIPIIEPSKEFLERKEQERNFRIWGCGVKPVCANCDKLIDNGGDILGCKARCGMIPRDCADNLTCARDYNSSFRRKT